MTKDTGTEENIALKALQSLVQDHGDAFRWSISKRGRIWLTLTHWDTEKYNTSIELDGMATVTDMLGALAVLVYAHYAKCFLNQAHADSWLGTQATKDLVPDATDVLRKQFAAGWGDARSNEPTPTE